ncbi:MAG: addiction module protein [Deltaproteobacteria bacterium]|jgi:hypothetical protein|nr:addiction module protein [Deltaproteobacteria bacterium]
MITANDEPLARLLERPPRERAEAARRLIESLDSPDSDPAAADSERVAELVRRAQELAQGHADLIDGDLARQRVLARLRTLRS